MKKQRFEVTGMTCSACSAHIEKSVGKLEGISQVRVNLLTNSMQVVYEETLCSEEAIIRAVQKAGYGAAVYTEDLTAPSKQGSIRKEEKQNNEHKVMKSRLIVSVLFMLILMIVSMHHMFFDWLHLPVPAIFMKWFHGNENALTFAFTQFLLTLPIIYVNRKYYQVGFKTLFHKSPNMDSLIAIGSGAALVYGIFAIYRIGYGLGHGDAALVSAYASHLYFESAGMILALITVGKYLEARSKGKTGEAIEKLMDLSPQTAILLTADKEETVIPTEQLKEGDLFVVKPGSLVPADAVVVEGVSSIDESAITGESIPVEKQAGDKVVSATMNKAGRLVCRASRVGANTTLAQIIRLVEEAAASKAPIARLADKIAGIFVPMVIGIAGLTFIIWMIAGGGFENAMQCAISVLVISCPCALGLATPVAIMVGTGVGARNGILIKSGDALQRAGEVDLVVLDKTGTITEGKPRVTDVFCSDKKMSETEVLTLAAAIEKPSEHPLAEAIMQEAKERNLSVPDVTDFKALFGKGVQGTIGKVQYLAGNSKFMEESSILLASKEKQILETFSKEGKTVLLLGKKEAGMPQGTLLAVIAVMDTVKASSLQAIQKLQNMKIDVVMLTGDQQRTAQAVKEKLHLKQVIAEVLPEDKEQVIRDFQKEGKKVAMIGDGINDAPALVAADVGIAIGAGTDVAIDSADIILMKSSLMDAITAIRLSKAVIRNIKQNLFWAFFYNVIGIPLAAGVFYPAFGLRLNPMFGAAAMSVSSLFVVGNALRLRRFKGEYAEKEENADASSGVVTKIANHNTEKRESMKKVMTIEGMMCGHCTARVQKVLEAVEGVERVVMSLEEKTAEVWCMDTVTDEALKETVTEAGYEVVEIKS